MNRGNVCVEPLRSSRKTLRMVRPSGRARRRRGDFLITLGGRPEDLVLLDLSEAIRRCQATVDREPPVRVPEVRQVESTEADQRHSRVTDDEIICDLAAPSAVSNIEVENLAAPFGEHLDRVVEWTRIARTQLEEP